MDGSQKIPQRWLATVRDRLARDESIERLAPRWRPGCTFCAASTRPGSATPIDDPLAADLAALGSDAHAVRLRAGIRRSGPRAALRGAGGAPARGAAHARRAGHAGGAAMKLAAETLSAWAIECLQRSRVPTDALPSPKAWCRPACGASIRTASRASRTTSTARPRFGQSGAADRGHAQRPGHHAQAGDRSASASSSSRTAPTASPWRSRASRAWARWA